MRSTSKIVVLSILVALVAGTAVSAYAADTRKGEVSKAQATTLHKEEQLMASQHGGHIIKAEQKVLNQQENAVSKQIDK